MTQEERSRYAKPARNTLRDSLNADFAETLTTGDRKANLSTLETRVMQLQEEVDEKHLFVRSCRKEFAAARQRLKMAEHELVKAKENFHLTQGQLEAARQRIESDADELSRSS